MKETNSIQEDKIENVRQVEVKKQLHLKNRFIQKRGHTLFEVNKITGEVVKAEFEEVKDVPFQKAGKFALVTTKKVIMKENCTYVSALNIKNCFKKLGYVIKK